MTGAAIAVTALVGAASAWACVPQPAVLVQPRSSGEAGGQVTVTGRGFGDSRAEIRWNSFDGDLLAAVPGPEFSTPVTIPRDPAGLYTLVVVMRAADGSVANTARAPFDIIEAGTAMPPAAPASQSATAAPGARQVSTASSGRATAALVIGLVAVALAAVALVTARRRGPNRADGERSGAGS